MQIQDALNLVSWLFLQKQSHSWKPLTAVPKNLHLTSLKEACNYSFIEYVQKEQQIYAEVYI